MKKHLILWIRYNKKISGYNSKRPAKSQPGDVEIFDMVRYAKYSVIEDFDDAENDEFHTDCREELKIWLKLNGLEIKHRYDFSEFIFDLIGAPKDWKDRLWVGYELKYYN